MKGIPRKKDVEGILAIIKSFDCKNYQLKFNVTVSFDNVNWRCRLKLLSKILFERSYRFLIRWLSKLLLPKVRDKFVFVILQKQPASGVLRKRYFENMQQIYRRTLLPKCDFSNVALQLYWNRNSLLHIFRTPFYKNTSGGLLLILVWELSIKRMDYLFEVFFYLQRLSIILSH